MSVEFMTFETNPRNRLSCLLGDTVNFVPRNAFGVLAYTLVSSPAGSAAAFSGSELTPDLAGTYTVTVENGSESRTVKLVAFPISAVADLPSNVTTEQKRNVFRSLVNNCPTEPNDATLQAMVSVRQAFNADPKHYGG